jgi:hypothetical protein
MALSLLIEAFNRIGLVALPFTIYFGWKRIGYRVAASYSWRSGGLVASGISNITLINMKDRPLAIFGIHAVMEGLSFSLKELNPPLILKGLEATTVEIDAVSGWRLGVEPYKWDLPQGRHANIDIYLSTATRTVKCRRESPPSAMTFALSRELRPVIQETTRFNGVIYNEKARYALTYIDSGVEKTSIIDLAGIIHWDQAINGLRLEDMKTADTVRDALVKCGIGSAIAPFAVDDIQTCQPGKPRKAAFYPIREPNNNA